MTKETKQRTDGFQQIEEATVSTEQFIERNQKLLLRVVGAIIIIIAIIFGYNRFYKAPRADEALRQMFMAENYFARDSFRLALNGDAQYMGFLQVADEYASTPSGNLANYYAGLCYLYTGDYQAAITHLQRFSSSDLIFSSLAKANIGDAYMQLGDYAAAAKAYTAAAAAGTNLLTTPIILMKAGEAHEKANNYAAALAAYQRIEKEYPESMEARFIEKYITRAQLKMK